MEQGRDKMFILEKVRYKNILEIEQLNIEEGTITCILGESGSGKTTLLRLLNHLVSCDQGSILYKGKNIKEIDAVTLRREVVMQPQSPLIFPGTIRDNLLIGLAFSKKDPVDDEKLQQQLQEVGVIKALNEDAGVLSGGEKQRLALIRIMLMDPPVILLDEPTSALDDNTGETVMDNLKNYVQAKKKTLVMVTHSRLFASTYGETIVTLNGGKVKKIEKAGEKS